MTQSSLTVDPPAVDPAQLEILRIRALRGPGVGSAWSPPRATDANLRGRQRGDIAGLIRSGLADMGVEPSRIEVIYSEREAVARGVERLGEQDLLVVLAEDVGTVLEQLRRVRA